MAQSLAVAAIVTLLAGGAVGQTTWYVDDDNCPGGSGTSEDPFCGVQDGIDAALDGDTVMVLPGTYVENIDFIGKRITVASTDGPEVTIIDGGQAGTVVTFVQGEGSAAVLDGFTVTNGLGSGTTDDDFEGAGIHCQDGSSPTITRNIVTGNYGTAGAAVMCNHGSSPTIRDNLITANTATDRGGGIACHDGSSPLIANNVIRNNTSLADSPYNGGGGIGVWNGGSPTIVGNVFEGNQAISNGGAAYLYFDSYPVVTNNIMVGNSANRGGAIACRIRSYATITNNTITENTAQSVGGALFCEAAGPTLTNCVLWGDSPDEVAVSSGSPVLTYCNVQGGWTGTGNIDEAPLFVDPYQGDFHLQATSPCIDAGDNLASELPATDFDGDPRIAHAAVDIGADEYVTCVVLFDSFGAGLGGSWGWIPELNGSGGLCTPGNTWLHARWGLGGASGMLLAGTETAEDPFFGGTLYVDLEAAWMAIPITLGGSPGWPGAGGVDLVLPDLAGAGGLVLFLQAAFVDAGAPQGVSLTNGLRMEVDE